MLVLDPAKRLTIAQIKEHKWMLVEVPVQRPVLYPQGQENEPSIGEFNEQVLRLMILFSSVQSLSHVRLFATP